MLHDIIGIILLGVIFTAAVSVLCWTYRKRYALPQKQIRMKPDTFVKTIAGLLEMRGEMKTPNILLCGQSGAGKSSAVNFLFRNDIAAVSNAEPCTEDIQFYAGTDINFYDSEGYEIGSGKQEHYCRMLFDGFLNKPENQKDDGVHLIWYTISAAGKRYTSLDIQLMKQIADAGYKINILVTKIDALSTENLTRFCSALRRDLPDVPVFRISTVPKETVQKHCDWQKLISWSYNSLPEVYQGRFLAGLRAGLEEKRLSAGNAVKMAALAAGGVGASPIPFSDAALILPIQTAMVARIIYIYGINLPNGTAASLLVGSGIQSFGRYIAGNLLKLIPGLGDVAGGMINASIAAGLTFAVGEALTSLCHNRCVQTIGGERIDIDIEQELADPSFLDSVKQLLSSSTLRDTLQKLLNKPY
ncbi:MAG: GTP-binding DUF697 domain-containing protein [Planctomycetaceae bacterium]|jgi:uncharacterized protein (DUF697 family)/GTP-binding protein EngB required for normal cell division|nr:GTP-binding DUF697 domain-containing protein [Planctomycetaceae bacterium]